MKISSSLLLAVVNSLMLLNLIKNQTTSANNTTNTTTTNTTTTQTTTQTCTLIGNPITQAFPSLGRCYSKDQTDKCCNLVHDSFIDQRMKDLILDRCDGMYDDLQTLFCLACNPSEYKYINRASKEIYLCQEFAEKIWGDKGLDKRTDKMDICGFKVDSYLQPYTTNKAIVPSQAFANFTDFLYKIQVPFYEGYTFRVIPTSNSLNQPCYVVEESGSSHVLNIYLLITIAFLILF